MAVHVIGLTGGIASGKSTVARLLAERGAAIVDADQIARQVVEPGQPALAELVARFGVQILAPDGTLDRKRLGSIAFSDPSARADLGRITHPRIAAASAAAIATWADAGANVVFYEAALLVENRAHAGLAALVVVSTPVDVQHARLVERDGLSAEEARARIAAQAPLADKIAAATWVVENTGDRDTLVAEVERVVAAIEARFGTVAVPPRRVRRNHATGQVVLSRREVALVTGYPSLVARRMIARLLAPLPRGTEAAPPPPAKIFVLARERSAEEARAFAAALPHADRVEILVGDPAAMDLGLSSFEYRTLAGEVTWIHHLAGTPVAPLLDLARDAAGLERLVHWSSARVSGERGGTWRESDLEAGQRFHTAAEKQACEQEQRVRAAMRQLPITVLRPGLLVGDSTTGESDRDGDLVTLLATRAGNVRLPLLAGPDALLSLVPVDFAVDAAWHVARSEGAAGKTFHLTDPAPLAASTVLAAVTQLAHTSLPTGLVPRLLAREVIPAYPVHYDQANTAAALAGTGLRCPPAAEYLPRLVAYALDPSRLPVRPSDASDDPLG